MAKEVQSDEEYSKFEELIRARTEQLRACVQLNLELIDALKTVRAHLGPRDVRDMGIDGRIYPISGLPHERTDNQLPFMEWYPVQVKQSDRVGRPDVDKFEAVMMREGRTRGYFVAFSFSSDTIREMNAFFQRTGREIIPFTVQQLLDEDFVAQRRPPSSITTLPIQSKRAKGQQ